MKNNLSWFRHYTHSHTHPKFKLIKAEYGFEGLGRFWTLCELIAESTDCWLDLKEKYNRGAIAEVLGLNIEQLNIFLNFLLEDCKLLIMDDNKISTEEIQLCYGAAETERKSAKDRYSKSGRSNKKTSPEEQKTSPENPNTSPEDLYNTKTKTKTMTKNSSSSNSEEPEDNNGNDNPFLFLSERFQEELQLLFPELDKEKREIAKTVSREFDLLPPEKQNFPYLKKRLTNQFEELEIRRREERHRKEKQRIQSERRSQINSPVETPPPGHLLAEFHRALKESSP